MRCRFVVDVDVNPRTMPPREAEKVRTRKTKTPAGRDIEVPYFPAGTEYEHPNAAFFVRQGMAEPADDECRAACGHLTDDDLRKLQHAQKRQALGILPKDWPLYDAGYIAGYDTEGEYAPGPNWAEYQQQLAEAAAAEEEDDI